MVAGYLTAERDLRRVVSDADIDTLAPTLIGAAHLLFTDADGAVEPAVVARVIRAVLATTQRHQRHANASVAHPVGRPRRGPVAGGF